MPQETADEKFIPWKEFREVGKQIRAERRDLQTQYIEALPQMGFTVEKLTDFQFRINGVLDVFPTNKKYHFIPDNRRGRYKNLVTLVLSFFPPITHPPGGAPYETPATFRRSRFAS